MVSYGFASHLSARACYLVADPAVVAGLTAAKGPAVVNAEALVADHKARLAQCGGNGM